MGPLLFNIALHDLFAIMNPHDIANLADNNTPYVSGKNIHEIVKSLEEASRLNEKLKNGQYEKLLGVTVDTKLSLKTYPADMGKSKNKLKGFG